MTDTPLVNRIAASGLITIKLEDFFPSAEVAIFDLKDYLFMELILKEKAFRAALIAHDWTPYQDKQLVITCSADAIIPVWAYMLVVVHATPFVVGVFQGTKEEFYKAAFSEALRSIQGEDYTDKRVVIKGCSDKPVPPSAYVELTHRLRPYAKSIMYGEPCSTVPLYKKPRK